MKICLISTYIPSQCGLANFSRDLLSALRGLNKRSDDRSLLPIEVFVVAIDQDGENLVYPKEVGMVVRRDEREDYLTAANYINKRKPDLVLVQHEFGIFGGDAGEMLFDLLENLEQPIVTTLHTILTKPDLKYKEVTSRILKMSQAIVVMSAYAKRIIVRKYCHNPFKIAVIPHGVTLDQSLDRDELRTVKHWRERFVLMVSGLVSPSKGFEDVIKAMPYIVKAKPEALLLVVGQTHPNIKKKEGETYRNSLVGLVEELGVQKNVIFVNRYLSLEELLAYLALCDVYLTPHIDLQQASSGTLAYALGMGRACVSTPYIYARETLKNGRGILVEVHKPKEIVKAVLHIANDPELRESMEKKSAKLGETMTWERVAESNAKLFQKIIYDR